MIGEITSIDEDGFTCGKRHPHQRKEYKEKSLSNLGGMDKQHWRKPFFMCLNEETKEITEGNKKESSNTCKLA